MEFLVKEHNDTYTVSYDLQNQTTQCICLNFIKVGFPCRHMFTALRSLGKDKIPTSLLLPRWMKGAVKKVRGPDMGDLMKHKMMQDKNKSLTTELWAKMISCTSIVQDDKCRLKLLLQKISEIESQLMFTDSIAQPSVSSIGQMIEDFAGRQMQVIV